MEIINRENSLDAPPPSGIHYFRLAKRQAERSSYKIKIGAVLVNKRPISNGFNKLKTHPKFAVPGVHIKLSIHAELDCILDARGRKIKGSDIYIYREDKFGNPKLSRPCKDCMKLLKDSGIDRCFYSTDQHPFYNCEVLN